MDIIVIISLILLHLSHVMLPSAVSSSGFFSQLSKAYPNWPNGQIIFELPANQSCLLLTSQAYHRQAK